VWTSSAATSSTAKVTASIQNAQRTSDRPTITPPAAIPTGAAIEPSPCCQDTATPIRSSPTTRGINADQVGWLNALAT
jgi:hypothetical protein